MLELRKEHLKFVIFHAVTDGTGDVMLLKTLLAEYNVLIEFLLNVSFYLHVGFIWSFYPLAVCVVFGMTLIIIGCSRHLRESLHKILFL